MHSCLKIEVYYSISQISGHGLKSIFVYYNNQFIKFVASVGEFSSLAAKICRLIKRGLILHQANKNNANIMANAKLLFLAGDLEISKTKRKVHAFYNSRFFSHKMSSCIRLDVKFFRQKGIFKLFL